MRFVHDTRRDSEGTEQNVMVLDLAKRLLNKVPGVRRFAHTTRGQALRHRLTLHFESRVGYTFTQFFRLPAQLDALTGPVLDFVGAHHHSEPLRIVVIGCSTGAEPYTISSVLLERWPQLAVTIDGYDVDADVLTIARSATYPTSTVRSNPLVTDEFVAATFNRNDDLLAVKPQVAQRVNFHQADALNIDIRRKIPPADIVFAQNVMCNLRRPAARVLFDNAAALLKPRSALFIDGMDLDMRERGTRARHLVPLTFALQRIHDEARLVRGDRYPWFAAGLEPSSRRHRNFERRYATIFLRAPRV